MNSRRAQQAGFTLLEIMLALVIIATVLVALLGLQSRTIGLGDRQQKITQATLLAQERMSEIEIASDNSAGDEDGIFAEPFATFRWQARYEPTPLAAVRMITVTVAWGEAGSNEEVALTSFLFQ